MTFAMLRTFFLAMWGESPKTALLPDPYGLAGYRLALAYIWTWF
jgi:hypothetical protein